MQKDYYQNNNYYKYGHQNNNFNTTMSQTTLKDFEVISKLGEGSFSQVFQVKRKSDGMIYAMKKVKMGLLKEKEKENALNEVRILASLNDEFIVGYKEAFIDEPSQILCVVMEYAAGGDLQAKITANIKNKTMFPESEVWKALIHMSKGLQILHEMQILHRDLKCANVFLSSEGAYKLGDLNVSKVAKKGLVYTQTGTPYYASPEVWRDEPYDVKSDIWSLGCVLYEMCALKPPFRANDMEGLYKKVQKGDFERIPKKYSEDLQRMLTMFLKVNPKDRPSCEQILSNPIVQRNGGEDVQQKPPSNKKLVKKSSKAELLQTILLPKNLGLLKGKLPKANYKKAESIDDIELDYENEEKEQLQQQLKKTNRIVSAGVRRTENYVNNLGNRNNLPAPLVKQPSSNEVKHPLLAKEIAPLQQKQQYEVPSNYNPSNISNNASNINQNGQPTAIKPRVLGRPISGVVPTKNNVPPLSPIQGLAKVKPTLNRPTSGASVNQINGVNYNKDYNSNRVYAVSEPIKPQNNYYSNQPQLIVNRNQINKEPLITNNNPYRNVADRQEIPSSNNNYNNINNNRYSALNNNDANSKNLTPQQYLMKQQNHYNELYNKHQNTPSSANAKYEDLNTKLAIKEKALLGGGGVNQNQNVNVIADKYSNNNNNNQYNIQRIYSEQNVMNYGKPQRIQSSKPYVNNNNYNYDIYQKESNIQQQYKSPQYGQYNNNNNNNNYNVASNNNNNIVNNSKAYDPSNYMYGRRQQSANIIAQARNQVYGNQQVYSMPIQPVNNILPVNRQAPVNRPVWWG
ncbi:hypothetical protein ABPG72_010854 [Tetrahymena utriculariae]